MARRVRLGLLWSALATVAALASAASAATVNVGNASAADSWPGVDAGRQAARYKTAFNALADRADLSRSGLRIVAIRCLPSANARYYCHTLFRPARASLAVAGEACLELELQPPFTVLRTWPIVCDDGSGAVFAAMPKSMTTPNSRLPED